jgi:hypothetical protein
MPKNPLEGAHLFSAHMSHPRQLCAWQSFRRHTKMTSKRAHVDFRLHGSPGVLHSLSQMKTTTPAENTEPEIVFDLTDTPLARAFYSPLVRAALANGVPFADIDAYLEAGRSYARSADLFNFDKE